MRRAILAALAAGTVITSALGIGAATQSERQPIDREKYGAALAGIDAAREATLARCNATPGTQKEVCRARIGAAEAIRVADRVAMFRRTRDAARNAQRARVEARYVVERAECMALGGTKRDQCQISAHAARGRALLEAAAPYETRS
jgi:hypothetical protein